MAFSFLLFFFFICLSIAMKWHAPAVQTDHTVFILHAIFCAAQLIS